MILPKEFRLRVHNRLFKKPLLVLQIKKKCGGQVENVGGMMFEAPTFEAWRDASMDDLLENLLNEVENELVKCKD